MSSINFRMSFTRVNLNIRKEQSVMGVSRRILTICTSHPLIESECHTEMCHRNDVQPLIDVSKWQIRNVSVGHDGVNRTSKQISFNTMKLRHFVITHISELLTCMHILHPAALEINPRCVNIAPCHDVRSGQ